LTTNETGPKRRPNSCAIPMASATVGQSFSGGSLRFETERHWPWAAHATHSPIASARQVARGRARRMEAAAPKRNSARDL